METVLFLNASQFVLILTRITAMMVVAPMFAGRIVPIRFRVFLAVLVATLLMLHQEPAVYCFQNKVSWLDTGFLATVGSEFLLGILMGTTMLLFFGALQVAGTAMAYAGGISFPVDGGFLNDAATPVATMFYVLGTAVVFLTGGHLMVMESLLESFSAFPTGTVPALEEWFRALPVVFYQGFQVGIHMALPILTVVLLAQIGLAVLNRVLPQLDIFGMSFAVNVLAFLFVLSLTLGTGLMLFQGEFRSVWERFFVF
ncbi:MAG: flagellar biosynthetic protein FliR [Planctomycetia bacterium]|nr:flagellar biosynthetic protein FliR [Planctomycetia bacterium]